MPDEPKFKVGQVVMYARSGKKSPLPLQILEIVKGEGGWFYRINRKDCLFEKMIRPLTPKERGEGA